jgi:hypothetical protein
MAGWKGHRRGVYTVIHSRPVVNKSQMPRTDEIENLRTILSHAHERQDSLVRKQCAASRPASALVSKREPWSSGSRPRVQNTRPSRNKKLGSRPSCKGYVYENSFLRGCFDNCCRICVQNRYEYTPPPKVTASSLWRTIRRPRSRPLTGNSTFNSALNKARAPSTLSRTAAKTKAYSAMVWPLSP